MRLPPELQSLVCQNMSKAELKVARLICKSFDQAAVPFLFDEVFVTVSYSELDIAGLIASRFGSYVKTVTVSFFDCDEYSKEEYREHWTRLPREKPLEMVDGHLEHAFKSYCEVRKEYLEIIDSGEFLARLCHLLCKFIYCRKIVLTDQGNHYGDPWKDHRHDPWKKEDLCPYPTCPLSKYDHISFFLRPIPPSRDDVVREWDQIFLSLSVTKPRITEFEVIGEDCLAFLPISAFTVAPRKSSYIATFFKTLTKLRLSLRTRFDTSGVVAGTLSAAINLESLFIEGDNFDDEDVSDLVPSSMPMVLGGCRFTKLRSLSLVHLSSEQNDLPDLLRNSPLVDHLTIRSFLLNDGTWELLAAGIRAILQLKSVEFDDLRDRNESDDFFMKQDEIEDFFLRNGKNPFKAFPSVQ